MIPSLVSVGLSCYNGQRFLREAINSVFAQTYPDIELIVIDDGSTTDQVEKICGEYGPKLRYVRQENMGLSGARNTGIREGRGEFVAFIDDDDIWMPDKIEKQIRFYRELREEGRDPGLINTGLINIRPDGHIESRGLYRFSGWMYGTLIYTDFVGTPSSVLVPQKILHEVGVFDAKLVGYQDWDLWLKIAKKYEIFSFNECLTQYRHRDDSLSRANVPEMVRDHKLILEKILNEGKDDGSLDSRTQKRVVRYQHWEMSQILKEEAYRSLFNRRDGAAFRRHIRSAFPIFPSNFGPKVWIYYLLSFFSAPLCSAVKQLKKTASLPSEMDEDIRGYDFDR